MREGKLSLMSWHLVLLMLQGSNTCLGHKPVHLVFQPDLSARGTGDRRLFCR